MKKYLYLLLVAIFAAIAFTLTGCDDDEPDENNATKVGLTIDGKKVQFTSGTMVFPMGLSNPNLYWDLYSDENQKTLYLEIYEWDSIESGIYLSENDLTLAWGNVIGKPTSNNTVKLTSKNSRGFTLSFSNTTFKDMTTNEIFTVNGTIRYYR